MPGGGGGSAKLNAYTVWSPRCDIMPKPLGFKMKLHILGLPILGDCMPMDIAHISLSPIFGESQLVVPVYENCEWHSCTHVSVADMFHMPFDLLFKLPVHV